MSTDKNVTTMY